MPADVSSVGKTDGMRLSSAPPSNLRGQVVCFGKKKECHGLNKSGDLLMDDLRRKTWTVSGHAYSSAAETRNELIHGRQFRPAEVSPLQLQGK